MDTKNIAYKLREAREKASLTQEAVAQMLGITQKAFSKIESGDTRLRVEHLHQLAEIYKIDISELFHTEGKNINIAERQIGFQFAEKQIGFQFIENQHNYASKEELDALRQDFSLLKSMMEEVLRLRKAE